MPRIRRPLQSGKYNLMHNILDLWSEANEDSPFTQGLLENGGPNDGGDGWAPLTTSIIRSQYSFYPMVLDVFMILKNLCF
ncbi:Hypothetical protein FKW44_005671 [Caligus rogercresseyi]|uniref:Uncharacterized protein n=1 Tax=Caligus rogercresseyi TaxID=217165 RepID=A0A7T8QS83_CALRO|nr:Hypothetical protein FKW44_005671 [Caligus rogercresseyi]